MKKQQERTHSPIDGLSHPHRWMTKGMLSGMLIVTTGLGLGCASSPPPTPSVEESRAESGPKAPSPPAEAQPGVAIPTSTGLIYEDVVLGEGPRPLLGQRLQIRYTGRLEENGPAFDKGTMDYDPVRDKTIRGWLIGIAGNKEVPPMRVGGIRKLTIPPHLGYGGRELPNIPPNSTLLFEVQLVRLLNGSASPSTPFSAP